MKKKQSDHLRITRGASFFKTRAFTVSEISPVINLPRNKAGAWLQRMKNCYVVKNIKMKGSYRNGFQKRWRFVSIDQQVLLAFLSRYSEQK
jgi:DNA-binding transcriptional regulator GbsR (MarR family)